MNYQEVKTKLKDFISTMNKVNLKALRTRELGGGKVSRFVPIDAQEALIDKYFLGLWQDISFDIQQIENEVTGIYKGMYFHPIAEEWFTIIGVASLAIQQKSNTEVADFKNAKIKNALEYNFPALYANAKSNARSQLGKMFGRGINRKDNQIVSVADLATTTTDLIIKKINKGDFNFTNEELQIIRTDSELIRLYNVKKADITK